MQDDSGFAFGRLLSTFTINLQKLTATVCITPNIFLFKQDYVLDDF